MSENQLEEEPKIIGRNECEHENCILVPKRFYDNNFKPLYYNLEQIIFLKLAFDETFFNDTFLLLPKVYNYFNTGVCVHFNEFQPYMGGSSSKMFMGTEYNGSKYLIIDFEFKEQDDLMNHLLIQSLLRDEDKNIIPQLVSFTFYKNKNDNELYIQILMEDLEAQNYKPYAEYIMEIVHKKFNNISKQYSETLIKCKHNLLLLIKTYKIKQTYKLFLNWKSYIEKRIDIQEKTIEERLKELYHEKKLREEGKVTEGRDVENVIYEITHNESHLKDMKLMKNIAAFFILHVITY